MEYTMPQSGPPAIEVIQGDITRIEADAVVNAANSELAMGGGVCGAIFRAAGVEELTRACKAVGRCPTGSAAITPAFGLSGAKHIIHAVGPVYSAYPDAKARDLLRSAYRSALRLAAENQCRSIAFPAISTGIYGYPLEEACREAVDVCRQEAAAAGLRVLLVAFDDRTAACLRRHLNHAEGSPS
jgi:O-acetyl-ADP-ribose deacetylase (regulator of RNase III)